MTSAPSNCSYCQQPIAKKPPFSKNALYCCAGCETADELTSGKSLAGPDRKTIIRYQHLSIASEKEGIKTYDKQWSTWELILPHIHCSSCLILLEKIPQWLEGVHEIRVSYSAKRIEVSFDKSTINPALLAAWLDHLGYPPRLVRKHKSRDTKDIWHIGLAGFAFGNAMMGAFPEYFGLNSAAQQNLLLFFRYSTGFFATLSLAVAGNIYLKSAFTAVKKQVWSLDIPIAIGMLALWFWSSFLLFSGTNGGYFDSLAGLVFFLRLGRFFQKQTYSAFSFESNVNDFLPLSIFSCDQNAFVRLNDLNLGECIELPKEGVLPVDVKVEGKVLVDYSFITGESDPIVHQTGDIALMGGRVLNALKGKVYKLAPARDLEKIWQSGTVETGWVSTKVTAAFTMAVITLSILATVAWWFIDPTRAVEIGVSILIIACPCALSLAAPFAYGTARTLMSKMGLFLKSGEGVARLGDLKTVAWDKTGTLTHKEQKITIQWHGEQEPLLLKSIVARSIHPIAQGVSSYLEPSPTVECFQWQEHLGQGISAVDDKGRTIRLGSGRWLELDGSATYMTIDGKLSATINIQAGYRETMEEVLQGLAKLSLNVLLISGDHPKILPKRWLIFFKNKLFFNQQPEQKAAIVRQHDDVLFIGDGLNDIQALQASKIGLSLVEEDLGYFPKSDGLLLSISLTKLPAFIAYAKNMRRVVKLAYGGSLAYNLIGIVLAVLGWMSPVVAAVLMPLSSISVVLFAVLCAHLLRPKI